MHRLAFSSGRLTLTYAVWVGATFLMLRSPASSVEPPKPSGPLSVAEFFQKPEFTNPKLSFDGRYLAFLGRQANVVNLFVIDRRERKLRKLTGFEQYDVTSYAWIDEKRLVFFASDDSRLTGGVHAIDADGKKAIELVENLKSQLRTIRSSVSLGWFEESELPRQPSKEVLLHIYDTNVSKQQADLYRVNTLTGKRSLVLRNSDQFDEWQTDQHGRVRLASKLTGTIVKVHHRKTESDSWELVREIDLSKDYFQPICFDADEATIWAKSTTRAGRAGLFKLHLPSKQLSECVAQHEKYDIHGVLRQRWNGSVAGYTCEEEKWSHHWFEPELAQIIARVEVTFPGLKCSLASSSADCGVLVLQVWGDREPGRYFLYDRSEKKLEVVGVERPEINSARLAPMEPFRIKARDGLELEGYFTPPAVPSGQKPPLIVYPHGGPWARDSWGFDQTVQFLASRGYAVLQVNFRGSTGYGHAFWRAGIRQWGLKMQDDITDAVKWCVDQGKADPKRIGIFGASYGGFAALAGLLFTPELYRCGVSYAGVTDIGLLTTTLSYDERPRAAYLSFLVGDPSSEKEYIRQVSPLNHLAALRVPLFLAYGFRDQRVDIKHANELVAELKRLQKPYELMVKEGEGHGFQMRENVVEFYTKLEAFLAKHLATN